MVSLPSPKYSLCREVGKVKILKSSLSIVHSTFTLQGVNIFCQSFKTQKDFRFIYEKIVNLDQICQKRERE